MVRPSLVMDFVRVVLSVTRRERRVIKFTTLSRFRMLIILVLLWIISWRIWRCSTRTTVLQRLLLIDILMAGKSVVLCIVRCVGGALTNSMLCRPAAAKTFSWLLLCISVLLTFRLVTVWYSDMTLRSVLIQKGPCRKVLLICADTSGISRRCLRLCVLWVEVGSVVGLEGGADRATGTCVD